jgi:hypothetical protein
LIASTYLAGINTRRRSILHTDYESTRGELTAFRGQNGERGIHETR